MNQRPTNARGAALTEAVQQRACERRLSETDLASTIGVSRGYLGVLMAGHRDWASVRRETLEALAQFLDIPLLGVYMLAEVIQPKDFYRASTIDAQVDFAFEVMAKDKRFIPAMRNRRQWEAAPLEVRLLCAILYQDVAGKDLLEKASMIHVVNPDDPRLRSDMK